MSTTLGRTSLAYARAWHLVDVSSDGRTLGRLATSIAQILMGKHKPIYDPSTDCGDYVVAVSCQGLHTTGRKRQAKKYYSHSMRPGRLKEITMDRMMARYGGAEVLRRAVSGMLPKNRLRDLRLARLKAFEGPSHPYTRNIVRSKDMMGRRAPTPIMDAVKAATGRAKMAKAYLAEHDRVRTRNAEHGLGE